MVLGILPRAGRSTQCVEEIPFDAKRYMQDRCQSAPAPEIAATRRFSAARVRGARKNLPLGGKIVPARFAYAVEIAAQRAFA
jgi:hypothetical protein